MGRILMLRLSNRIMESKGSYVLLIDLKQPLIISVGSLGMVSLPDGLYAYVGSARRGISGRIARHRRLAELKAGRPHWHIDYLLANPFTQLAGEVPFPYAVECAVSRRIALIRGVRTPVPGFGSTDCRSGCRAHLYLLPKKFRKDDLTRVL
jgi:sugar fermentation stimulation protein A